uniref:uncharacterized protein LOC118145778 isoform X1 n=1 Tax=Callithrix jacchus TaxID=9483 RepID=UPI0023DD21AC|nr:uncharacterized protein LOC118145778 isoform X1 [Callithrix jacchus]
MHRCLGNRVAIAEDGGARSWFQSRFNSRLLGRSGLWRLGHLSSLIFRSETLCLFYREAAFQGLSSRHHFSNPLHPDTTSSLWRKNITPGPLHPHFHRCFPEPSPSEFHHHQEEELSTGEQMRQKDSWARLTSSILRNSRTIKFHGWEGAFLDRVLGIRGQGLSALWTSSLLFVVLLVSFQASTFL